MLLLPKIIPSSKESSIPAGYLPESNKSYIEVMNDDQIQEVRRERLKKLIDDRFDGRNNRIAEALELADSYVSRMLYPLGKKGKKPITAQMVFRIESLLGLPRGWMDDETIIVDEVMEKSALYCVNEYPVLTPTQAGTWGECAKPELNEFIPTTERVGKNSFWLRVEGDSMVSNSGISFPDGTLILADPDIDPINKNLVVAKLQGVPDVTFKQLIVDAGKKFLKPLNPYYPVIEISDNCNIVGVVKDAKLKLF
ncbi:LexA family transcriptional repressor [Vibrio cholerae]|nr:LexA family transcriptional repressor [Vibrio cholerae]EGR4298024.1 LexA family transcriptional repressor [Vibrio cholerae]